MIWVFAFIILPSCACCAIWYNWKRANKAEQRLKDSFMEIDLLKERLHAVALENERRRASLDVYEKRFAFYQKTPSIMSAISDTLLKGGMNVKINVPINEKTLNDQDLSESDIDELLDAFNRKKNK